VSCRPTHPGLTQPLPLHARAALKVQTETITKVCALCPGVRSMAQRVPLSRAGPDPELRGPAAALAMRKLGHELLPRAVMTSTEKTKASNKNGHRMDSFTVTAQTRRVMIIADRAPRALRCARRRAICNGGMFAENQDLHAAHTTHASHAHNGPIQIKARAATQGVESGRRTPNTAVRLRAAPETARPRSVRRAGQL